MAFASEGPGREGSDDSELMSAPMDLQPGEQEVFFSEEKMREPAPELPNPTERASEGQPGQGSGQPEENSATTSEEGGRFDEEKNAPDAPYSPKPKDRGHGIPPHKDATNTGPGKASQAEGAARSESWLDPKSGSGAGHPAGDEDIPAAAI